MKNLLKTATIGLFTAVALLTTACNTVQGVGQDIESTGKAIDKAAK